MFVDIHTLDYCGTEYRIQRAITIYAHPNLDSSQHKEMYNVIWVTCYSLTTIMQFK